MQKLASMSPSLDHPVTERPTTQQPVAARFSRNNECSIGDKIKAPRKFKTARNEVMD